MSPSEKKRIGQFNAEIEGAGVDIVFKRTAREETALFDEFCDRLREAAPSVRIKKEDADEDSEYPAIVVSDRLQYRAVPSGKELEPFLEALKLSSGNNGENGELKKKLSGLSMAASFEVFISPQCPYCPLTVGTLAPMALANGLVRVAVIDAAMFPELARKRDVRSVPSTFLDDAFSWTGAVDSDEVVEVVKNRDPSQLSAESLKNMIHGGMARKVAEMMDRKGEVFPSFLDLLFHEKWTVRLGAMVAVEELAEMDRNVASKLVDPIWEAYGGAQPAVRGDLLYILGEVGGHGAIPRLNSVIEGDDGPEVKEAAREAVETIRDRFVR